MCPHLHLDIHVIGDRTLIACSSCLTVLDHDIPTYTKS